MIKCEVINDDFTLKKFDELKNIKRKNESKNQKGKLYVGDIFECSKEMADYLTGNNPLNKVVVKVIEVEPKKEEPIVEAKIEYIEEPIKPKAVIKSNKKKKK